MDIKTTSLTIGEKLITVEFGKLAFQSNIALTIRSGDTIVLVSCVASKKVREDIDFFPLICDYEEKLYAAGKIPGGFIKREGKPSEKAILTSRLIDRSVRPLFPKNSRFDTQIIATPLSVDNDNMPDILAVMGTSFALSLSDIPWEGPIGVVRVCRKDNKFIVMPSTREIAGSPLDIVVVGQDNKIIMIETKAQEVEEKIIIDAIHFAQPFIQKQVEHQRDIVQKFGKQKLNFEPYVIPEEILQKVREKAEDKIYNIFLGKYSKKIREEKLNQTREEIIQELKDTFPEKEKDIIQSFEHLSREYLRNILVEKNIRVDGRRPDEIRDIACEVGVLPRVHGSGLFTRGETQVLTTVTLGAVSDEQKIDGLQEEESKRFMHQYNFPPFSVGEIRPLRGPGRRDIGHGALAEKALEVVLPPQDEFPYTIRLVSEVLSSNGSTSMASVCASSMALMDAGIPITSAVAGIAMGIIVENGKVIILSDISGIEDAYGDMDFKVAGTSKGICALQLDIKSNILTNEILSSALHSAREGRLKILKEMSKAILSPREKLSPYSPRIFRIEVPSEKVGEIIGPGGKNIKKIIELTDTKIDIQDNKFVYITAPDEEKGMMAKSMIEAQIKDIEVGEIYSGRVMRITPFGAFVEIAPGKEGLLHISNIRRERTHRVEDVLSIGDIVRVKVIEVDDIGRISLSRKALL